MYFHKLCCRVKLNGRENQTEDHSSSEKPLNQIFAILPFDQSMKKKKKRQKKVGKSSNLEHRRHPFQFMNISDSVHLLNMKPILQKIK